MPATARFHADDIAPDVAERLLGAEFQPASTDQVPEHDRTTERTGVRERPETQERSPQPTPHRAPHRSRRQPAEEPSLNAEEPSELAETRDDLLNGFPFAGVVQRHEDSEWAFLCHVPLDEPLRLGELKERPGVTPGRYRIVTANGRREIELRIAGTAPEPQPAARQLPDDPGLRRRHYEHELQRDNDRYQQRVIERLRDENQDLGRQLLQAQSRAANADANQQRALSEQRSEIERQHSDKLERARAEADRLRDEKHQQDMKILRLELQQELQPRTGETGWDVLKRFVENNGSDMMKMLPQILAEHGNPNKNQLLQQMQQAQASSDERQASSQTPRANPSPAPAAEAAVSGDGQVSTPPDVQPSQQQSATPADATPADDTLTEQFIAYVVEAGAQQLDVELSQEVQQQFAQQVIGRQRALMQQGLQPDAGLFTELAERLSALAIERAADPVRIAYLLVPFMQQLKPATLAGLKYMPAPALVEMLAGEHGLAASDDVRTYLIDVIKALKAEA